MWGFQLSTASLEWFGAMFRSVYGCARLVGLEMEGCGCPQGISIRYVRDPNAGIQITHADGLSVDVSRNKSADSSTAVCDELEKKAVDDNEVRAAG